jgi:hypothetical protein
MKGLQLRNGEGGREKRGICTDFMQPGSEVSRETAESTEIEWSIDGGKNQWLVTWFGAPISSSEARHVQKDAAVQWKA